MTRVEHGLARHVKLSRRSCLLGLLALSFSAAPAAAGASRRVAALDWAIAEAMIGLGLVPEAIAERDDYNRQSATGILPDTVIDLGLRDQVSLELLQQVAPELILLPAWQMLDMARLSRIAPTVGIEAYGDGAPALDVARRALIDVARSIGREERASALIASAEERFSTVAAALAPQGRRRIQIVSFLDERHAWVYGGASLFHGVSGRVGLDNVWGERGDHVVTVGFDALVRAPDAWIVFTQPLQPGLLQRVQSNPLWQGLPAVRTGRTAAIPPLLAFGGIPTAMWFASELQRAFTATPATESGHG